MSTLADIRDLETRLHSHVLEWQDRSLVDELFYLLDDLQYLHDDLDRINIPATGVDHFDLTLRQRVSYLIQERRSTQAVHEPPQALLDFYGKPLQPEPNQLHLFEPPPG